MKDVLKAIAEVQRQMADVQRQMADVQRQMATKTDLAAVKSDVAAVKSDLAVLGANVDAHRAETKKGFEDLDQELSRHASVHRELETDVEALKKRPPRTAARPARAPRGR